MTKFTTQLFCLATLALGVAYGAASYEVTLSDNVTAGGTKLKAVEIPATSGKSEQPFSSTVLVMQYSQLKEIDLGGTQDKIVFAETK
jgi:hypothetical protein